MSEEICPYEIVLDIVSSGSETKFDRERNTLTVCLDRDLSQAQTAALDTEGFVINNVFDGGGVSVRVSKIGYLRREMKVTLGVPRSSTAGCVCWDWNDLLGLEGALTRIPRKFLVVNGLRKERQALFFSTEQEARLPEVRSYLSAVELARVLRQHSDHNSHSPPASVFFEVDRLEIPVSLTLKDLDEPFPVEELAEFLNTEERKLARVETFRGTLWDLLKDYPAQERFQRILVTGRSGRFIRSLKHNFAIVQADLRLDRRLEKARAEHAELSDRLAGIVSGIETKALAIPTAIFLLLKFLDPAEGFSSFNLGLIVASILIAIILTGGFVAQRSITKTISEEIEDATNNLIAGLEKDQELERKFNRLKHRITVSNAVKALVMICAWIVPLLATANLWIEANQLGQ